MEGVKGLLGSKKAVLGLLMIALITVFLMTGKMTMGDWRTDMQVILLGYFGIEGASGIVATVVGAKRKPEIKTVTIPGPLPPVDDA